MPLRKIRRPATKDKCRKLVNDNIRFLMEEGRPQKQAVAIALSAARKNGCRIPDTRKGRAGGADRVFVDAEIRTVGGETFATVTWLDTHGKRHSAQGPRHSAAMRALLAEAAEDGVRARHVVKPTARGVDHAFGASGGRTPRLFIGVYPGGMVYADRHKERDGDYARVAFLPWDTLEVEVDKRADPELVRQALAHATLLARKSGQAFAIDASGHHVLLGSKLVRGALPRWLAEGRVAKGRATGRDPLAEKVLGHLTREPPPYGGHITLNEWGWGIPRSSAETILRSKAARTLLANPTLTSIEIARHLAERRERQTAACEDRAARLAEQHRVARERHEAARARREGRAGGRHVGDVPMGEHRFEKYAFELSGSHSEGPVRVKILDVAPGSIFKTSTTRLLESFHPDYSHRRGYTLSRKKAFEFYKAARDGATTSPRQQAKDAREATLIAKERRKIQEQVVAWGGSAEGEYAFLDTAYGRLAIHPISRDFIATRFLDHARARPWTKDGSGKWNFHGDTALPDFHRALGELRALRCTQHTDCKKNEPLGRACLVEQARQPR